VDVLRLWHILEVKPGMENQKYVRWCLLIAFLQRVLYTANVGDARAILARKNIASRLSYDHKGSDPVESRRIVETGGFMMNHRVNGTSSFINMFYSMAI
jgi:serine/threonine protein phosphatase PrpC